MATTSTALPLTQDQIAQQRPRDRRATIFRVVAGVLSVGILFGALIVFFLLAPWTLLGPTPDDYVAEMHRWHHADSGALLGILVVGSLLALIPDPRRRSVLAQAIVVALVSMITTSLLDERSVALVIVPVVATVIIVAAYPARRELVSLRRDKPVSLPLLALALATAIPLLRNLWDNVRLQSSDHSQHATEHHWSGSAAVALALVLTGLLVASRRPGWRALGVILGLTYFYLGAAALTIPDHDGSWGTDGGLLALVAGAGFIAATVVEGRRATRRSN